MGIIKQIKLFLSGILTLGSLKGLMESDKIIIVPEDFFNEEDLTPEEYKMSKSIHDLKPDYDHSMDIRGTPTHLCPCGCNIWNIKVMFEDFEISTYFLEMECANCGTVATAPTLLDKEAQE